MASHLKYLMNGAADCVQAGPRFQPVVDPAVESVSAVSGNPLISEFSREGGKSCLNSSASPGCGMPSFPQKQVAWPWKAQHLRMHTSVATLRRHCKSMPTLSNSSQN